MRKLFLLFLVLVAASLALAWLDFATHPRYRAPPTGAAFRQAQVAFEQAQRAEAEYETVSLVALLANPAAYDKRRVRVSGYACLEFEHLALYLDKTAFDAGVQQNAVWVDSAPWMDAPTRKRFTRRYLQIEGTFNANEKGYGSFSGTLQRVQKLHRIEGYADYYARQGKWANDGLLMAVRSLLSYAAALVLLAMLGLALYRLVRPRRA